MSDEISKPVPPNTPPPSPPPDGPTGPTPTHPPKSAGPCAPETPLSVVAGTGPISGGREPGFPARHSAAAGSTSATAESPGGPPSSGAPSHPLDTGECLSPGYGTAARTAVPESAVPVVAGSAGASSRRVGVREGGPARRGFTVPPTARPPEFVSGSAQIRGVAAPFLHGSINRRGR
jgi:hypothetical protein